MSARSILAVAAGLIPLTLQAGPAAAHAGDDRLLAALPAHAPAGVCYARVSRDAAYTPPGPPHARWRLQPGSPGPVWCLVTEPGAPPVLIREERHGWIRVRCDTHAPMARVVRRPVRRAPLRVAFVPPPMAPPPPVMARPCCTIGAAPPPPPPVVTITVPAPTPPRSPWLSWSGKSIY